MIKNQGGIDLPINSEAALDVSLILPPPNDAFPMPTELEPIFFSFTPVDPSTLPPRNRRISRRRRAGISPTGKYDIFDVSRKADYRIRYDPVDEDKLGSALNSTDEIDEIDINPDEFSLSSQEFSSIDSTIDASLYDSGVFQIYNDPSFVSPPKIPPQISFDTIMLGTDSQDLSSALNTTELRRMGSSTNTQTTTIPHEFDMLPQANAEKYVVPDKPPERKCYKCQKLIEENGVFISGEYYHQQCSLCQCGNVPTVSYKNHLFCSSCRPTGTDRCSSCGRLIESQAFQVAENFYHIDCLSCYECGEQLTPDTINVIDNCIFCQSCTSTINSRICATCNKPIYGKYSKHFGKFYHSDHFICEECGCVLIGNNFVRHHNRAYCHSCGHSYEIQCTFCKLPIDQEQHTLLFHGKPYHSCCFVCRVCGLPLNPASAKSFHGRPHCPFCFDRRNANENAKSHKHSAAQLDQLRDEMQNVITTRLVVKPIRASADEIFETAEVENTLDNMTGDDFTPTDFHF